MGYIMKRNCVTVAPTTLTRIVKVRILIPLPDNMPVNAEEILVFIGFLIVF